MAAGSCVACRPDGESRDDFLDHATGRQGSGRYRNRGLLQKGWGRRRGRGRASSPMPAQGLPQAFVPPASLPLFLTPCTLACPARCTPALPLREGNVEARADSDGHG